MTFGAERIGILGLGRSGLAVARAVRERGGVPVVFDSATEATIAKPDVLEAARGEGIEVRLGSQGPETGIARVVSNPAVDQRSPVLAAWREAGAEIWSEVEFAYRISRAPIVAVTGTNGKSTTTVMAWQCLRACGIDAVLCGNIFGSGYAEVPLTEAAAGSRADQVLVAEVSSFQLEQVSEFRPVAAAITNITPDHQDRYDAFADYAATKQRIFAAQTASEFAIVRASDPVVRAPKGPTVLTFGSVSDVAEVREDGLRILRKSVPAESLPFRETHNLANAACAALMAYGALRWIAEREPEGRAAEILQRAEAEERERIEARRSVYSGRTVEDGPFWVLPDEIVEGLRSFQGLAHRMERVGERDGVLVINNSMCTNPAAVVASASSVRGRKLLLIGGVDKELDFRPVRSFLASGQHRAFLFGTDGPKIAESLGSAVPVFATMQEAFQAAAREARAGDVLMLAPGCASTDQFRDFRDRGDVFRQIAKDWLNDDRESATHPSA